VNDKDWERTNLEAVEERLEVRIPIELPGARVRRRHVGLPRDERVHGHDGVLVRPAAAALRYRHPCIRHPCKCKPNQTKPPPLSLALKALASLLSVSSLCLPTSLSLSLAPSKLTTPRVLLHVSSHLEAEGNRKMVPIFRFLLKKNGGGEEFGSDPSEVASRGCDWGPWVRELVVVLVARWASRLWDENQVSWAGVGRFGGSFLAIFEDFGRWGL
jgi:hypothetical protein